MHTQTPEAVFVRRWRQFAPGDRVPEHFGFGMVQTMIQAGIAKPSELAETPAPNKAVQMRRIRKKGR